MKIIDIKIGDRARADLGDISSLARSIEKVGLLHPVVVDTDGTLIAGARRIAAFTMLGRDEIPHMVAESLDDALARLVAERDENIERKSFTPGEAVIIAERLQPLEKKAAEIRKAEGQQRGGMARHDSSIRQIVPKAEMRAADKVAAAVGISRTTLDRAKEVVDAAREDPRRYGPILDEMNRTGKVHRAYMAIPHLKEKVGIRRQKAEQFKELAAKGMRAKEIAAELGISTDSVYERAQRANIKLAGAPMNKEQKIAKLREMAEKGAIADQIGSELGIRAEHVRVLAKKEGIHLADSVVGRRRHLDVNRIVEQAVISAEAWAAGLNLVESRLLDLDCSRIDHWLEVLTESIKAINRLMRQLKHRKDEYEYNKNGPEIRQTDQQAEPGSEICPARPDEGKSGGAA
jgi:ParB-like chromosome segregation protein Spo0J